MISRINDLGFSSLLHQHDSNDVHDISNVSNTLYRDVQKMQREAKAAFTTMDLCIKRMKELNFKFLSAITESDMKLFENELSCEMNIFYEQSIEIKRILDTLSHDFSRMSMQSAEAIRMQMNQKMLLFSQTQSCMKQMRVARTERFSGLTLTESDGGNLFAMKQSNRNKLYDEIVERNTEILQLEKSLKELFMLFQDIALLTADQGDTINIIDTQITNVQVDVEVGVVNIQKAKWYQSSARKKMCCILVIIVIVVLVLFSLLFGFLHH